MNTLAVYAVLGSLEVESRLYRKAGGVLVKGFKNEVRRRRARTIATLPDSALARSDIRGCMNAKTKQPHRADSTMLPRIPTEHFTTCLDGAKQPGTLGVGWSQFIIITRQSLSNNVLIPAGYHARSDKGGVFSTRWKVMFWLVTSPSVIEYLRVLYS